MATFEEIPDVDEKTTLPFVVSNSQLAGLFLPKVFFFVQMEYDMHKPS